MIVGHSMVLRFLRNDDHIHFYETLIEEQAKNIISIILLRVPFNAVKELLEKELAVNKREKRTDKTKRVKEAAIRRSRSILHLKLLTEAHLYGTDMHAQQAATKLIANVYSKQKAILKAKLQEQTRMCDAIVGQLGQPEYAGFVETLKLVEPLKEFIAANEDFKTLHTAVKTVMRHSDEASIRVVRSDLDVAFTKLTDTIDMLYKINDMGSQEVVLQSRLAHIINAINDHIINAATGLSKRGLKYGRIPVRPQLLPVGNTSAKERPQE